MDRYLLFTDTTRSGWSQDAKNALETIGSVEVITQANILSKQKLLNYRLLLIDSACDCDVPDLIRQLRKLSPDALIVVSTASPHANWARNIFKAGADDFLVKTGRNEFLAELKQILSENATIRSP